MKLKLVQLPVKQIVAGKDNPRTINTKSAAFAELVASVKARGVMTPVHVRAHPQLKDKYELLAGERRWRACRKAKVARINAIDHGAISDGEGRQHDEH